MVRSAVAGDGRKIMRICRKKEMNMMSKIVVQENGILRYKVVAEEDLTFLKKEIEEIIKKHRVSMMNTDKICVSVNNDNGGDIVIDIGEHTFIISICNICSANFEGEELSLKDAITLNITTILDNFVDILEREKEAAFRKEMV